MRTHHAPRRNRAKHQAAVALAALAGALAMRAGADTYYLQPNPPTSPVDWDSTSDFYYTWRVNGLTANKPVPGADVIMGQVGANGVSNSTVNLNYAYAGTGLTSLTIDSNNTLSQTLGTSVMVATNETVGNSGTGAFNQSGGSNNVSGNFICGSNAGSVGTYVLSNSATLLVSGFERLGYNGTGVFNQTGGRNTAAYLLLGGRLNTIGVGTYNLSNAGTLVVGTEIIDNGVFNQSGGSNIIGNELDMNGATYNLSNAATLVVAGSERFGIFGPAVFNQTGGSNTCGTLHVGSDTSPATYNLSNSATLSVAGDELLGTSNVGVINQTGGMNTSASLTIGGLDGTYNLSSSGRLSVVGTEDVGAYVGFGEFNQTGGSNTCGLLILGDNLRSSGTYNLSNSATLSVTGSESIGGSGLAVFNQTGGTNASASLILGSSSNGTGSYALSGGTLLVPSVYIGGDLSGSAGTGTVNVTGGLLTATNVTIWNNASGLAISGGTVTTTSITAPDWSRLSLTGGTLNLSGVSSNAGTLTIGGGSGLATLNVLGPTGLVAAGTITVSAGGVLNRVGLGAISYNTLNLAGGTLNGDLLNNATFNYTGGTFSGRLTNQGVVNITNNFTAGNGVENDATMTVATGQALTVNGLGLANNGLVNLAGGSIKGAGPIVNSGQFTGFGTLGGSGAFSNYNLINQSGGNLILSGSNSNGNYGSFNLAAGWQLQLTGSGLSNFSALNLNGGLVAGTGALVNSAGTLSGPGTITGPFSNAGGTLLVPGGALNVSQSFVNGSSIQLAAANAALTGGTITNTGTLQGLGTVSNAIINTGTIEAIGGTLNLGGIVTNLAGGLITASTGNKVFVTAGLPTNAGTISLVGGTFDNNGKAMTNTGVISLAGGTFNGNGNTLTNTGEISGYGILRTGGLTNNPGAGITVTGGFTTINGAVTNAAGASIRINYNPAIFTGAVVNNGTIKTLSSTVTFAAAYSGSGTFNSDPATNNFQSDINIFPGGQVLGGVGDVFNVSGTYTNAGLYLNAGGTLSAQNVVNNGQLNQTAGQATMLALTGTGSLTVGGAGTALVSVSGLTQSAVTVNNASNLNFTNTPSPSTAHITTLNVGTNGLIDLQNHSLLLNSGLTPFGKVKAYIDNAYHLAGSTNGAGVVGDYQGRGGITSTVAKNSYGNGFVVSLGYYDGAQQAAIGSVVGPNAASGNGTGIGANQILVRPTFTGDLNGDGVVDDYDIAVFNAFNFYNNGTTNLGYQAGDFNGDGVVDDNDIAIFNAGNNYNNGLTYVPGQGPVKTSALTPAQKALVAKATAASSTLTGHSATAAASSSTHGADPASATLNPSSGTFVFTYDPATGDVKISLNGYAGVTGKPVDPANLLNSLDIKTTGGAFALDPTKLSAAAIAGLPLGTPRTTAEIKMTSSTSTIPDGTDLGLILQPGLDPVQLAAALTLQFNYKGSGAVSSFNAGLSVPEPTVMSLLGLGAVGLLARRRRNDFMADKSLSLN